MRLGDNNEQRRVKWNTKFHGIFRFVNLFLNVFVLRLTWADISKPESSRNPACQAAPLASQGGRLRRPNWPAYADGPHLP